MITQNPFTSDTFTKIWKTHFNKIKTQYTFNFLQNLSFFKPISILPLFINTGKNLTKGISFSLNNDASIQDFKKKVFLIYDIPQFFKINTENTLKKLRVKKIKQYSGFLINMENYKDFDTYFSKTFSSKSRQSLKRHMKRLDVCFDIKEKVLIGNIEKSEYDFIFNQFKILLTKRFEEKQITNNNLNPEEWNFYYEVVYPLILERKAALHVIYNDKTPINITLLYFSESIIFYAMPVFDTDYSKFRLGKISLMKLIEWSFESDYKIFDFSKGYFDYKESLSDVKYDFDYHILYDSKSIFASTLANLLAYLFKTKQYLRAKKWNEKLHKLTFALKKKTTDNSKAIKVLNLDDFAIDENMLCKIELNGDYDYLKQSTYDFLFLNQEHFNDLRTYRTTNTDRSIFLLKGKNKMQLLEVIT